MRNWNQHLALVVAGAILCAGCKKQDVSGEPTQTRTFSTQTQTTTEP